MKNQILQIFLFYIYFSSYFQNMVVSVFVSSLYCLNRWQQQDLQLKKLMKILIKNNSVAKLFNGEANYQALTLFVKKEFQLQPFQYTLTYVDEDGDNITLASNEDILSAYEINSDKNLLKVKLNLTGTTGEEKMDFQVISQMPIEEQKIKGETIMGQEPKAQENHHHKGNRRGHRKRNRSHHKSSSGSSHEGHHSHGKSFRMIHEMMNLSIAEKIDERVKNLIPCIKAQLEGGHFIKTFSVSNPTVHENTECKSCLSTPIVGIRYKCLECPVFDLCENCEPTVQHGHNLLKMKFVAQKENKLDFPFRFFNDLRRGHHGHGARKSHSPNSNKYGKGERITRKLAKIFGGEAQRYEQFTRANKDLNKFEIINKYAAENGQEELLINFRCEKIAKRLKKNPQQFREMVRNNMNLRPWQMIHKISNIEVGTPLLSGGKCDKIQKKCEKYDHKGQKEERKAKKSLEKKGKSHEKRQRSRQRSDKGKILQTLIGLFGEGNVKEYFELIETHFSKGQEAIINMWLQANCSKSSA